MLASASAMLFALLGVGAPAGAAGPPTAATGTFQIPAATDNLTITKLVAGNIFFHEVAPLIYAGDVTGPALDTDDFVVHANGTFQGQGVETCASCTIGGRTGSYVAEFNFVGNGDDYTGRLTILDGAGGLSGLRGGGFFAGTESGTGGTYDYQFSFNP